MKIYQKIGNAIDSINTVALYASAVLIGVLLFGVLYGAIARIFMAQPPFWPDPVTSYSLFLATVLAAPRVFHDGQHIVVDALIRSVSLGVGRILLFAGLAICAVTCSVMGVYAAKVTGVAIDNGYLDVRAISVPFWVLSAPLSFCFLMMAVESVRKLVLVYSEVQ